MLKIITVDGPSGVGKGTLCERLCQMTGFHFLDSGAIYRSLAYGVILEKLSLDHEADLVALAASLPVQFQTGKIYYTQDDITQQIRNEEVAAMASQVAAIPSVRAALLQRQKDFAQPPGLVADGRDMGTVVFPQADLKLFLTASAQIRAERRVNQLKNQGLTANIDQIISDIEARDERDRNRSVAPLIPADDAFVIDTTSLNIEQVVEKSTEIMQQRAIL
ncbi:(d)CMP kinase [Thiomicrospira cyclica]|uniref:Cytidylate kinase n=1 Tax=Thiomicrospira cyclica (strain DSM 14477 / JCM 11371 / ALM1) TaxID=717773 RepID=F6DCK0_THICA|nr:(d)CMP kinase [Thiomicrospira cyclica]AEG31586.1 Cytidylate kinase [Thiomicrospira cyclica ALM1]